MAYENPTGPGITAVAAVDLSDQQYNLMRLSAENSVNISSGAGFVDGIGVLHNKPQSGEYATIYNGGHLKARSGAAVAAGKNVTCNTSGRAIAITSGTGAMCYGKALTASGGDGQIFTIEAVVPFWWEGAN